jgi:predicted negative regulator of RcsB-dependent stress response
MKVSRNQSGIGHLVLILSLVVVAAVAFAGYRVVKNSDNGNSSDQASTAYTAVPDKISNKADLQKASQALDNTAIDSSVNPSSLDNDLNSLL